MIFKIFEDTLNTLSTTQRCAAIQPLSCVLLENFKSGSYSANIKNVFRKREWSNFFQQVLKCSVLSIQLQLESIFLSFFFCCVSYASLLWNAASVQRVEFHPCSSLRSTPPIGREQLLLKDKRLKLCPLFAARSTAVNSYFLLYKNSLFSFFFLVLFKPKVSIQLLCIQENF